MSLAILKIETAIVLSSPWASKNESFGERDNQLIAQRDTNLGGEFRRRVDPRADRGAADRHVLFKPLEGPAGPNRGIVSLRRVTGENLANANRRGIHEMRAANLHDVVPRLRFGGEVAVQALERGNQVATNRHSRGNVHGGRERVVRRLAHVHMVVRVDRPCFAFRAHAEAELLIGNVGDDFVGVRICRGARARLIDVDRELSVVFPGSHLLAGGDDRCGMLFVELAEFEIGAGASRFQIAESVNDGDWHWFIRHREIFDRARGGSAIEGIDGHLHFAHRIAFCSEVGHRENWLGSTARTGNARLVRRAASKRQSRADDTDACCRAEWEMCRRTGARRPERHQR